jgi:two-component system sensor histidine kinase ChvG
VSRIGLRLLAFNVLVVFVPVLGILYLDVYEYQLRQAQERAMAQQAMILAAALGGSTPGTGVDASRVAAIFTRLSSQMDARLRVYDASGTLVGDSARHVLAQPEPSQYGPGPEDTRKRTLYRAGARIANAAQALLDTVRLRFRRQASTESADAVMRREVRAALDGRYGAATRITPGQRSMTMFTAVPVRDGARVAGAVVASQSTFRILRALYDVRLRVFEVVLASLVAAAALTALASTTIVRPLERLRRQATMMAERQRRAPEKFPGSGRRDELGDLARALEELTRRTNAQIDLLQTFSADVSHELKNPIASIRTAAEMMAVAESPDERSRFLSLMTRDVARLDRLVSSLREIALVERRIAEDPPQALDVAAAVREGVDRARHVAGTRVTLLCRADGAPIVRAAPETLAQVFDNLIANAVSFAPDGSTVEASVATSPDACVIAIEDRGPGIPESHLDRVFARFFTYRPGAGRGDHVGLGLAIARQIVESAGGTIQAANRDGGGARFEIRLPRIHV